MSEQFKLTRTDQAKWVENTLRFLLPVVTIYLGATISIVANPENLFELTDLVPSQFTLGAMMLYLLNVLYDLSRKYLDGGKS